MKKNIFGILTIVMMLTPYFSMAALEAEPKESEKGLMRMRLVEEEEIEELIKEKAEKIIEEARLEGIYDEAPFSGFLSEVGKSMGYKGLVSDLNKDRKTKEYRESYETLLMYLRKYQ